MISHDIWSITNNAAKINVYRLWEGNHLESKLHVIGKGQALHPVANHTFLWCLLYKYASALINMLDYSVEIPLWFYC